MDFGPAVFDKVSNVMVRGNSHAACWHCAPDVKGVDPQAGGCSECVSADLVDVETYPVTDYVIGEAASSGADHVSDALGFECRIQEN
jgi:hypothetical protein